MFDANPKKRNL